MALLAFSIPPSKSMVISLFKTSKLFSLFSLKLFELIFIFLSPFTFPSSGTYMKQALALMSFFIALILNSAITSVDIIVRGINLSICFISYKLRLINL